MWESSLEGDEFVKFVELPCGILEPRSEEVFKDVLCKFLVRS